MSSRVQDYWKRLRELEGTLPEFVWLVATAAGAPPFVTQAASPVAAKLLNAKSHRIATDEEVAAQRANDTAAIKQATLERKRRAGSAVVMVEEEPTTSEPSRQRRR